MTYRERKLSSDVKETLVISPGHYGERFDLDYFGHDDGVGQPFRLIFQLGSGYMIYLYVVGLPQPGDLHYFHTFWIKDCAVAEVDMEELGAPDLVDGGPVPLPVVYTRVSLSDAKGSEEYEVDTCRFEARSKPRQSLQVFWGLYSLKTRRLASLLWTNAEGWGFTSGGRFRLLREGERVRFSQPCT